MQVMRVGTDCAVIHGETLRQFLGGDAAVLGSSASANGNSSANGGRVAAVDKGGGATGTAPGAGSGGVGGSGPVAGAGPPWWLECFAVRPQLNGGRCTAYGGCLIDSFHNSHARSCSA